MARLSRPELVRIFADVLEVDPESLSEESSPENVSGWDSAKSMEIVITLEEALDFEFSAEELAAMASIGATKEILVRRGVFTAQ
jgi:acyl carrier protein